MAQGRVYTAVSGAVPFTGTAGTLIFWGTVPATATSDIQAIRVGVVATASSSFPSNNTVLFQLSRVTSTTLTGGSAVTANPHNSTDIAANTTFLDAHSSNITNGTQGVTLWEQVVPATAGANWAEWVTPGAEWRMPAAGEFGVYVSAPVAITSADMIAEVVFTE